MSTCNMELLYFILYLQYKLKSVMHSAGQICPKWTNIVITNIIRSLSEMLFDLFIIF